MRLTKRNYFSKNANQYYMSVSQWKAFEKCPASALAEINGKYEREKTTALLVGSYVDSYFEGDLENFKTENPEIFKKDGTLKAEYIQAEAIIQRILRDKLFCEYMSGNQDKDRLLSPRQDCRPEDYGKLRQRLQPRKWANGVV